MSLLLIVLPLGLVFGAASVAAFIWATRSGQFDDLDTPPMRATFDDDDFEPGARARTHSGLDAAVVADSELDAGAGPGTGVDAGVDAGPQTSPDQLH
ncbi:MAG: cbb3-type cytochrome oxidase assembly protein CcoS [Phycisphaerales bacterium]